MNCDNWLEPKNSLIAADTGLALIRSCGIRLSDSAWRQTLAHRALDPHQTGAELVFGQFADRTHAAVAEVIDVVDFATAIAQFDQNLDDGDDVFVRQRAGAGQFVATDAAVELHAAHGRQVVALFAEEQVGEQRLDRILGGRLARTHHAVDRHLGGIFVGACRRCAGSAK